MHDFETISDHDILPYLHSNIMNPLIQKVLCNLLNYYMKSATLCRKYYYLSAALTIVLPTLVTVVSSMSSVWTMPFINIFTSVVAGLSAVISGFNSLFKWQENWLRYRMGVDLLKKESINYIARIGMYSDTSMCDLRFLQTIERISDEMNIKGIMQYSKNGDSNGLDKDILSDLKEDITGTDSTKV